MDLLLVVMLSFGSVALVAYFMYRMLKKPVLAVINFFRSIIDWFKRF